MGICYNFFMHHKIIGYLLLFVGLATLFFAFTGMYQTFVNKKPVIQVVQLKPLAVNTQYGAVEIQADVINQILNISFFVLFMIFLAGLGSKVAGIGNNLLKTERLCETLQSLRHEGILAQEERIKKL